MPVLSTVVLRALVERALAEDLGSGDVTTRLTIPEGQQARGALTAKQELVVAGLPVATEVFRLLDASSRCEPAVEEGAEVQPGTKLAVVTGAAVALLAGERVALNFLQRLCGIATMTRQLKSLLTDLPVALLDTRKTTPGLRTLEKYAVRVGGGENHRLRLDDGILIKNNHLRLAGGVRAAVERALRLRPAIAPQLPIEVEVRNLTELREAVDAGAEAVLLDNMTPEEVRECVKAAAGRVRLEVSGGIDAANIRAYAESGVNAISVGALTHSAPAADINFLIEPL
ncbi:MAG: carboxylating nicotinate-nucleotide diphosphorylase [Acidobacteriia bacterium]|nr:carboxylating nicotinate-nucleotide diphosphorylase [Terriglobia bacterium]